MKRLEDRIQKGIIDFLRAVAPQCLSFSIPNGGYRRPIEAKILVATGMLAGVPDLALIAPHGKVHFLEVKTPQGVLSDDQREILDRLMRMCVPYAVVHSIDDVRIALDAWRIETREVKSTVQGE